MTLWAALAVLASSLPRPACGAGYYVNAASGNDSNPGTRELPWRSVARVNHARLRPGDTVYFRRGRIWRATLNVPASGLPGYPITFTAYPDDPTLPRPIMSCTEGVTGKFWHGLLGNGSFRPEHSGTSCSPGIPGWKIRSTHGYSCALDPQSDGTDALRIANVRGNTDILSSPVRLRHGATYTLEGRVRAGSRGRVYLYLYGSAPHRAYLITDENGLGRWIPAGRKSIRPFLVTSGTGWLPFTIRFSVTGRSEVRLRASVRGHQGIGWLSDVRLLDSSRNDWTLSIGDNPPPRILLRDGERISQYSVSGSKRWYTVGGPSTVVRYLPRASRPSARLAMGVRRTGILLRNKSYVTIENLVVNGCEGAHGNALTQGAGILLSSGSSHNVIQNVVVRNSVEGIRVQGAGPQGQLNTGNVFTRFVISNVVRQGIALRSYSARNLISDCRVFDVNMLPGDNVREDKEAVSIGGTTGNGPGNTIRNCEIYNVGTHASGGMGIAVFNSPDTTIRGNYVHDIGAIGIGVGANGGSPDGSRSNNVKILYNVVARTGVSPLAAPGQGIGVTVGDHGSIDGVLIANNTIADCRLNDNKDGGISIRGVVNPDGTLNTIRNVVIENNIVSGCSGTFPRALFVGSDKIVSVKNISADYNLYFPSSRLLPRQWFISFEGTNYTPDEFSDYQRNKREDRHSLIADPLFVDGARSNYHLRLDSPARQRGVDLGLHHGRQGKVLVGRPDIGAY